jgi:hypothetical protein
MFRAKNGGPSDYPSSRARLVHPQHVNKPTILNYTKGFILWEEEEEYLIIKIIFDYSLNNNSSLNFCFEVLGVK